MDSIKDDYTNKLLMDKLKEDKKKIDIQVFETNDKDLLDGKTLRTNAT